MWKVLEGGFHHPPGPVMKLLLSSLFFLSFFSSNAFALTVGAEPTSLTIAVISFSGLSHVLPKLTLADALMAEFPAARVVFLAEDPVTPETLALFPHLEPSRFELVYFPSTRGAVHTDPEYPPALRKERLGTLHRIKGKALRMLGSRVDYPYFEEFLFQLFLVHQPDVVVTGYLNQYWACDALDRAQRLLPQDNPHSGSNQSFLLRGHSLDVAQDSFHNHSKGDTPLSPCI